MFTEVAAWDEIERRGGYQLGRDEGEDFVIDSLMCFKRGDVWSPRPHDAKGCLGQIRESVYV